MFGEHLLIFLLGLAVALVFAFFSVLSIVVRRKVNSSADSNRCQCPPETSGKNGKPHGRPPRRTPAPP